jgi:hypothetical protein
VKLENRHAGPVKRHSNTHQVEHDSADHFRRPRPRLARSSPASLAITCALPNDTSRSSHGGIASIPIKSVIQAHLFCWNEVTTAPRGSPGLLPPFRGGVIHRPQCLQTLKQLVRSFHALLAALHSISPDEDRIDTDFYDCLGRQVCPLTSTRIALLASSNPRQYDTR